MRSEAKISYISMRPLVNRGQILESNIKISIEDELCVMDQYLHLECLYGHVSKWNCWNK